jgi:hypothetical protein
MSFGQGNIHFVNNPAAGSPLTNGARNGLSQKLGYAVLGQDLGELGSPADLLSNREIPLNGFQLNLLQDAGTAKGLNILGNVNNDFPGLVIQNSSAGILASSLLQFGNNAGHFLNIELLSSGGGNPSSAHFIQSVGKYLFSNNTGKDFLNINAFTQQYGFGDISSTGSGSQLQIDDLNELMQLLVGTDPYLFLDVINDSFSIGDINGATSSTYFYLDGTQSEISTGADSVFTTEHNVGRYRLGDLSSTKNSSLVQLNDNATLEFLYSVAGNKYLDLSPSNKSYNLGDIDFSNNGLQLNIDDQSQFIALGNTGQVEMTIDIVNSAIKLFAGNGKSLQMNGGNNLLQVFLPANKKALEFSGANFTYKIGDIDAANHHTTLVVDDQTAVQQILAGALNGIKITGDTTLLHTGTNLSNGAGASLGTLTNAPVPGDPAKWITIDDNGTTRLIPAWNAV